MAGIFVPARPGETGVSKIREVAETFELVIVVLLPVKAEYPIKLGLIPADVRLAPDPSQEGFVEDIST
jgi:hypothetical protein